MPRPLAMGAGLPGKCPHMNVTAPSWRLLCRLEAGGTPRIRTLPVLTRELWNLSLGRFDRRRGGNRRFVAGRGPLMVVAQLSRFNAHRQVVPRRGKRARCIRRKGARRVHRLVEIQKDFAILRETVSSALATIACSRHSSSPCCGPPAWCGGRQPST